MHHQIKELQLEAIVVPFCIEKQKLHTLIVKRAINPFEGQWAFPSGFMELHEEIEQTAERLLEHITGLGGAHLKQVIALSNNSFEEYKVISQIFLALLKPNLSKNLLVSWQASEAIWVPVTDERLQHLAFGHSISFEKARNALKWEAKFADAVFDVLNSKFTLSELQYAYEQLVGVTLDRRNFRKKLDGNPILTALPETRVGPHAEARLYSYNKAFFLKENLPVLKTIF